MTCFETMNGSEVFEWVATHKVAQKTKDDYSLVQNFVRSWINLGFLDDENLDDQEREQCVATLNLLNAIRWFQETYRESQ